MSKSSAFYNDYVKKVADIFIKKLEEGTAPWQIQWETSDATPRSAITEKHYRGMNFLYLALIQQQKQYKDPRWITFKQAIDLGGHVKKGEKGTHCIFWKVIDPEKERLKKQENNSVNEPDRDDKNEVKDSFRIPCPFTVFNVEQCEGLKLKPLEKAEHHWNPVEKAERILRHSGAKIVHAKQNEAYYSLSRDEIVLPLKTQFKTPEGFYDTALHELGHWTGHSSRLGRDMGGGFGSISYAKEELRAEIASMMISDSVGIKHDMNNHASYVASWIEVLKSDPKELFRAAADADRIKEFILDLDREKTLVKESSESKEKKSYPIVIRPEEAKAAMQAFKSLPKEEKQQVLKEVFNRYSKVANTYEVSALLPEKTVDKNAVSLGTSHER